LDINDKNNIRQISTFNTPGNAKDVFIKDYFAFIADNEGGLRMINLGDIQNPKEVGFIITHDHALSVQVEGNYAYVADGNGGVRIYRYSCK